MSAKSAGSSSAADAPCRTSSARTRSRTRPCSSAIACSLDIPFSIGNVQCEYLKDHRHDVHDSQIKYSNRQIEDCRFKKPHARSARFANQILKSQIEDCRLKNPQPPPAAPSTLS